MARFGRGQPAPPVFLHGLMAAVVVAATFAPQIHVVGAADRRNLPQERRARVVFLRGHSLVPDRLPRQITVVLANPFVYEWRHPARQGSVVILRAPQAPVAAPATPAPQIHVVDQVRGARPRRGNVVVLRGARSLVPDRLALQLHVILANPQASRHPAREADVTSLRAPIPPAVVTATKAAPFSVTLAEFRRRARTRVTVLHGAAQPALAATLPPKPVIVLARNPRRLHTLVVVLRGHSLVPARLAPQIHVFLQRHGIPPTAIVLLRGGPAPVTVFNEALWILDQSRVRYPLLASSLPRYALLDQSRPRYTSALDDAEIYVLTDQSGPRYRLGGV